MCGLPLSLQLRFSPFSNNKQTEISSKLIPCYAARTFSPLWIESGLRGQSNQILIGYRWRWRVHRINGRLIGVTTTVTKSIE